MQPPKPASEKQRIYLGGFSCGANRSERLYREELSDPPAFNEISDALEPAPGRGGTASRILNKVGVPRVTKGVLFWRSTPTANQVLKRLRRHLGVLGVLF
jgi:hypothetical protein